MSDAETLGRGVGLLIYVGLLVGFMLFVVLVPHVEKAFREYWISSQGPIWPRVVATLLIAPALIQSCA